MARKKKSTCNKWDDDDVEWRSPVRKDNQDHHKETDKATKQRGGLSWVTIQKHLTDRLAPIKKAIRDSLEPLRAERIIRKMEVSPGGSAMGMVEAQKHLRKIYGDMKEGEESNPWFKAPKYADSLIIKSSTIFCFFSLGERTHSPIP